MFNKMKNIVRAFLYWILTYKAIKFLRKELRRERDIKVWFDFVHNFHEHLSVSKKRRSRFSIAPNQVKEEIVGLMEIVSKRRPRTVLEIGTAKGGTLFLFCRFIAADTIIISIDLPGGPFGGGYSKWKVPLYKSFAWDKQRVILIRADSHNPESLDTVKNILRDSKLDVLFIDGDHTYDGVKRDFEMYSPLVRGGGIVAFHDIVPGPPENVGGVPKFWSEIKCNFNYIELVKDWNQGGYGIGIIYV